MTRSRRHIAWLLVTAGLAAGSSAASHAAPAVEREFHLPAQDLGQALRAVGRISGLDVMFPADAVAGRTAPALDGRLVPLTAIEDLLAGSGLTASFADGAILIRGRDAANSDGKPQPPTAADIVVTGSRIRGAQPTSPVISATRADIEDRGLTDLGAYARSLPQNYSGGQNPGVISSIQSGSENFNASSTLNLRGLGPDATLTLLDGHRLAYDATDQGIDISAIPLAAIDRIEIVADGASALYGSDAVGGVANVILRRDYEGLETSARVGAATDGGDVQQEYNAVAGRKWANGGFMIAADYSKGTEISAGQRSYTQGIENDLTLLPAQRQGSVVATFHQDITPSIEFSIDGQLSSHRSRAALPFTNEGDVYSLGTISTPNVLSYSVSPGLTIRLPDDWEIGVHGTAGDSLSRANLAVFSDGAQLFRNRIRYDDGLGSADLSAEGPLFPLPGGSARLAVGGGFRALSLRGAIEQVTPTGSNSLLGYTDRQTVGFGYGEFSFPVVGPNNGIAFVRRLTLSAATRYEHYSGPGGVASPKLGLIYQPTDFLTLKGSWGKSFKAPTLAQEATVASAALVPASDFFPTAPDGRDVILLGGGNGNLKPERATSWTATIEIAPPSIPELKFEFSHFDVHYRNRVIQPLPDYTQAFTGDVYRDFITYDPSAAQIVAATGAVPLGIVNQTDHAYDPANIGAIIDDGYQNAARQHIDGYDLSANYKFGAGSDQFAVGGSASHLRSTETLGPGEAGVQQAGIIFNPPHWRAQAIAGWTRDNASLTATFNYIGGLEDNRASDPVRVGGFRSVDATLQLHGRGRGLLAHVDVMLSALNLFNEKPSTIATSGGIDPPFDATNYPSIGRVVSLTISKHW